MQLIPPNIQLDISDRNLLSIINQESTNQIYELTDSFKFIMAFNAKCESETFNVSGCFAVATRKKVTISKLSKNASVVVINVLGFNGLEDKITILDKQDVPGNLSYIDGCSNTNIIDPPRNGDPCINYLYIPAGTNQTFHTHPSVRIILILAGEGMCSLKDSEVPLMAGQIYNLPRHTIHRFKTTDKSLSVMVFHPDSEDGPRDEHNPMKSRTYIK